MTNIRKAAIDGLVWGIFGKVLLILFNFGTLMITSRRLSAEEFGIYTAAVIFVDFSFGLANSTFGTPLIMKSDLTVEEERGGFASFLCLGLLVGVILAAGSSLIEQAMNVKGLATPLLCIGVLMPMRIMSGYYGSMLLHKLDMRYYQLTQNLPQILGSVVTIVGAIIGWGVWCLVAGFVVATVSEFGMTFFRSKAQNRFPASFEPIKRLLHIGTATSSTRMINFAATNSDRFIISHNFGAASLGLYARAYSLMMVPFRLLGLIVGRVFLSIFSKVKDNEERYRTVLNRILAIQAIVYIPLSIGLAFASPLLVTIVLGKGWEQTILLSQILFCALFARLGYEISINAFAAVGEVWILVWRQVVYFGMCLVLCLSGFFIGTAMEKAGVAGVNGLVGVACGTGLAIIGFYLLSIWQICTRFKCSMWTIGRAHLVGLGIGLIAAAVAAGATVLFNSTFAALNFHNIFGIAVYFLACGALYLLTGKRIIGIEFAAGREEIVRMVTSKLLKKRSVA